LGVKVSINDQINNLKNFGSWGYGELDDNLQAVPCSFLGRIYSWIFKRSDERIVNLALKFLSDNKSSIKADDAVAILSRIRPWTHNLLTLAKVNALVYGFAEFPKQVDLAYEKAQLYHEAWEKSENAAEVKKAYIDAAKAKLRLEHSRFAPKILGLDLDIDGFEAYMMLSSDVEAEEKADEVRFLEHDFTILCLAVERMNKLLLSSSGEELCEIIQKVMDGRATAPKMIGEMLDFLNQAELTDTQKRHIYKTLLKCAENNILIDFCIRARVPFQYFGTFVNVVSAGHKIPVSVAELKCITALQNLSSRDFDVYRRGLMQKLVDSHRRNYPFPNPLFDSNRRRQMQELHDTYSGNFPPFYREFQEIRWGKPSQNAEKQFNNWCARQELELIEINRRSTRIARAEEIINQIVKDLTPIKDEDKKRIDALRSYFGKFKDLVASFKRSKKEYTAALVKERPSSEICFFYSYVAKAQIQIRDGYAEEDVSREFSQEDFINIDGYSVYSMLQPFNAEPKSEHLALSNQFEFNLSAAAVELLKQLFADRETYKDFDVVLGDIIKELSETRDVNPETFKQTLRLLDRVELSTHMKRSLYLILIGGEKSKILDGCNKANPKFEEFDQYMTLKFPDDNDKEIRVSYASLRSMGGFFQARVEHMERFGDSSVITMDQMSADEYELINDYYHSTPVSVNKFDYSSPGVWLSLHLLSRRFSLTAISNTLVFPRFRTIQEAVRFVSKSNITVLDLSQFGKRVDYSELKGIAKLSGLKKLVMHFPKIPNDSYGEVLYSLEGLVELEVTTESEIDIQYFSNNRNLKILNLRNCRNVKNIRMLSGFKELKKLSLSGCYPIRGDVLKEIGKLSELEELDLTRCCITEGIGYLKDIETLKVLKLQGHSNVKDIGAVTGWKSLKKLSLRNCGNLEDNDLKRISKLEELEELDLTGCIGITEEGIAFLNKIPTLRVIREHAR
jgi:hypothetical protein